MLPKRVAVVLPGNLPVPSVCGGAIETIVQLLIDENERVGALDVTVFSAYHPAAVARSAGYRKTRFSWIRQSHGLQCLDLCIRAARRLFAADFDRLGCRIIRRRIVKGLFDMVVVQGNPAHLLALAKTIPKDRLVLHLHANLFKDLSNYNLSIGRAAGLYIAVSDFVKEKTLANAGVAPEHVWVIRNPIDLQRFTRSGGSGRPVELVRRYAIQPDEVILLFVGRIVESKGLRELLHALAAVPGEAKCRLFVVGSFGSAFGKEDRKNSFHREMAALASPMGSRVTFTGFVHNSELAPYFALADIVVMPSLCDEAAGMVAMEAMASGVPVVTTNAGGIPEYVNESCAVILDRDDGLVASMAQAIERLAADSQLRHVMGQAGIQHSTSFSPSRFYEDYLKLAQHG